MWDRSFAAHALVLGLLASAAPASSPTSTLSEIGKPKPAVAREDRYMLPVLGPYEIQKTESQLVHEPWGERALIAGHRHPGQGCGGGLIVGHVEGYAVAGQWIVGRTSHGYFMFDTRCADPNARVFSSRQEWQTALAAASIAADISIVDPEQLRSPPVGSACPTGCV
jgi:hypothetical protein